jgi:HSP20 family protein
MKDNRSFFEKLTGAGREEENEMDETETPSKLPVKGNSYGQGNLNQFTESEEEGELTVDVYQTATDVIIKTMVAGVKPEDLDVSITRDMVTIKGKRETERSVSDDDYYHRELYWGSFSRTIMLPAEVEVEECDAVEKHGLLIITLPKIDKHKQAKLRVKG